MSWCMTARPVYEYPGALFRGERDLVDELPEDHPAMAAFGAAGTRSSLDGRRYKEPLMAATGTGYGDIFPEDLPGYVANADWSQVQDKTIRAELEGFFRVCLSFGLGVSRN